VLLAQADMLRRMMDRPWASCRVTLFGLPVTLMSSGIASMLIAAVLAAAIILPAARGRGPVPRGLRNLLEVIVLFVRERIARPALQDRADAHLPFLLTLFVFIFAMNLLGLLPLDAVTELRHLERTPLGMKATTVPVICAALAGLTLIRIVGCGLASATRRCRQRRGWPVVLCAAMSPVLWVIALAPPVPGLTGKALAVPLALLELVGAVVKCFALMVRLLANMLAGHALVSVVMMFVMQAAVAWLRGSLQLLYVGPICILGGLMLSFLELLVGGLQAYIFTFLSATFLRLYAEPAH